MMTHAEKKYAALVWWKQLPFEARFYKVIAWLKTNGKNVTDIHPDDLTAYQIQEIWQGQVL